MDTWSSISTAISDATGHSFKLQNRQAISGGCINNAFILTGREASYFAKLNKAKYASMFEAEAEGLLEIAGTKSVRVPVPICWGSSDETSYLVMEYIPLGRADASSMERLGIQLAAMHRHTNQCYGWRRDSTIGTTPQINPSATHWPDFWRDHRLAYQLELAFHNGHTGKLQVTGERLLADVALFFRNHIPAASLLHGDLWAGNQAADSAGNPVIYDPAVYYGDRETDLAMTELFGGFTPGFYQAYTEAYPLPPDYAVRKHLYNLYHVLNHLNLFGTAYLEQAQEMIDFCLSEIR